ncbi:5-carboxymethyl-2-hydroxymuconate Delta-isomerase [Halococcus salifodinae DSM 8989]|uniref:5-carboxymethyl-2-hydroxymuconate Delta-isomerase n=1 Tax=Halococcus salifodinae DSM 8989 TaxID=1227456 RepID=M0MRC5_9EURY|nr:5-carboxymethyl-2-hydroxymuconate Delta-isomerase [Halococcus salifodinae DSM 8989]
MEIPDRPLLFLKPPNALAGHGDSVRLPAGKERVDWEAEFGVVIGEQCRHVDEVDTMDVVRGYTCVNDVSNRDDQEVEQNWVRGKAFDGAASMGPTVATPGEVPDDADIALRVNDETNRGDRLLTPDHLGRVLRPHRVEDARQSSANASGESSPPASSPW